MDRQKIRQRLDVVGGDEYITPLWGMENYILLSNRILWFGLVWFFNYGVSSVPVEHISLRVSSVVWKRHEGGCTVKKRSFYTVGECMLNKRILVKMLRLNSAKFSSNYPLYVKKRSSFFRHTYNNRPVIENSRGAGAQSVTINATGCGFDRNSRKWNIF